MSDGAANAVPARGDAAGAPRPTRRDRDRAPGAGGTAAGGLEGDQVGLSVRSRHILI